MDRLIYTAMTGANQAFLQQAGVANNLSNVSTIGFRAMENRFRSVPVEGDGYATRAFVVNASVGNVFDQGAMMATGRPLDVAVSGNGWIAVQDANGQEAYTRGGNLKVSEAGQLQTASGLNVLGNGGPIAIPPDNNINIASDGTVSVIPLFGTPNNVNEVGRIKLVNPPESTLVRGDDGLFRTQNATPANIDETVKLTSGTLEGSNVDPVESMVSMISLARQFEMHMKMISTADTNASKANQILSMT